MQAILHPQEGSCAAKNRESMPGKRSSGDDGELLAFAQAVGNYSDVTAAAAEQRERTGEAAERMHDEAPAGERARLEAPLAERTRADASVADRTLTDAPVREAIVPLLGMRMAVPEVRLSYARLVCAGNLAEAPDDAIGSDENVFAAIGCGGSMQAPLAATSGLRQLVTTLRLMKAGGVGLGGHGWIPGLRGWQRFSTGVGRPRPGGYELTAGGADALVEMTKQISDRGERTAAFAWALSRFDLGAERPNQVEALSDYLLALRALLEGGGPAKAGLTARAAALCAGVDERAGVRATLERALALERKLMSGDRVARYERSPLDAIASVEEMLRTMLRGMATGELGSDLRVTADEILLADGLRVGDGSGVQIGGTAEWRLADHEETAEWRIPDLAEAERIIAEQGELSANIAEDRMETQIETQQMEVLGDEAGGWPSAVELGTSMVERNKTRSMPVEDWLSEEAERELEWPSFASPRSRGKRREAPSERVRYLFPVPDETDWSVSDLSLGRKRGEAS